MLPVMFAETAILSVSKAQAGCTGRFMIFIGTKEKLFKELYVQRVLMKSSELTPESTPLGNLARHSLKEVVEKPPGALSERFPSL